VMLPQSELTPESLARAVNRLLSENSARDTMATHASARGKPNAANEIVSNLLTLVS
jgi:UDP-N-acetylglucosamine:LPS N-acetylglucosamine transferase